MKVSCREQLVQANFPRQRQKMNQGDMFREYLRIADALPLSVPFHILELPLGILIADGRDQASATTMQSVASRFGRVIKTESIPSKWSERSQVIGCLLDPTREISATVDMLRAAYTQAITNHQPL
ncbi:hypothetical protein RESH_04028 [Rhodopirellula europaea SH398]|uniref:Uncharacterized protein n=1 Tax=Rhodopirellula europaea SH398 TaxID=1263868 RepID=M5S1I6_9BACT|nr:hypothetical protein RESH_04028 [Rhodopirellula europaea SH398]